MESCNFHLLELETDAQSALVEQGVVSMESLAGLKADYDRFLLELQVVWTPEKIRESLLVACREAYSFYTKKRIKIEQKNADARMAGVSFAERRAFTMQIDAVDGLLTSTRELGTKLKKIALGAISASSIVPPSEVGMIQRQGMDWYLKFFHNDILVSLVKV